MKKEEKGREVLGWKAAIENAIARQVTLIGDSDSDGVPSLGARELSSSDEDEKEERKPIARRRQTKRQEK